MKVIMRKLDINMTKRNTFTLTSIFQVKSSKDYGLLQVLSDCKQVMFELSEGFFIRKFMSNPDSSLITTQTSNFSMKEEEKTEGKN
jgi:hypothetical protein